MTEIYGLLKHKPPQFRSTQTKRGINIFPLWNQVKFIDRDPHRHTRRVKEAIQIRLHSNNINRDSGIEIPDAWMPTIRKHNSRSTTKRTPEGTSSVSRNNNEDRNAPITSNQRSSIATCKQSTSSPDED